MGRGLTKMIPCLDDELDRYAGQANLMVSTCVLRK